MAIRLAAIAEEFSLDFNGDGDLQIHGLCGLSDNLAQHLSFVSGDEFADEAAASTIPAFVTKRTMAIPGKSNLFHDDPNFAIAAIAALFSRAAKFQRDTRHASAVIDASANVASSACIGANCYIGADVQVGANSVIHPGSVVMDRASLGADCVIYSNCTVREDCVLGERVILQPGVVIGGDGFGFLEYEQSHMKIPQLGNVIIEDDVEIGANSTVDRGRFSATRIGRGTKIDNNVMIAHNVQVGERCLIVAQSGISGSSQLGNHVVLAGQVGLVGHINIADNVTLLGQSMATKDIREAGVWAGSPARPARLWKRAFARLYAGLR